MCERSKENMLEFNKSVFQKEAIQYFIRLVYTKKYFSNKT